jgi:hypothetical protein
MNDDSQRRSCGAAGCVALALDGSPYCTVHQNVTYREQGSVAVYCYACGNPIRVEARWLVRSEGAFHLRRRCSTMDPARYAIPILDPQSLTEVETRAAVAELQGTAGV